MRISYCLIILLCGFLFGCFPQKIVQFSEKGHVVQTDGTTSVPFRYEKRHIFVDVDIKGKSYNFLLDTGADFMIVDVNHIEELDFKNIAEVNASGSSFKKQKTQLIEIARLSIAEIEFNDLGAAIMDLSFINDDYPCSSKPISGIIGANLLRKLNFQIDYINHKITFSDKISNFNLPEDILSFELTSKTWGSPWVNIKINEIDKVFILDTGSSGKFTTGLAFKETLDKANKKVNYIPVTKVDKLKNQYTDYYGQVDQIAVGELKLANHLISLEEGVSSLIGNELLENFIVTFDWGKNTVFLEQKSDLIAEPFINFEILLKPNYTTNKIEISRIYNNKMFREEFKVGTEILAINDIDVSNFTTQELCDFWDYEYDQMMQVDVILIELGTQKIELVKTDLLKMN